MGIEGWHILSEGKSHFVSANSDVTHMSPAQQTTSVQDHTEAGDAQ